MQSYPLTVEHQKVHLSREEAKVRSHRLQTLLVKGAARCLNPPMGVGKEGGCLSLVKTCNNPLTKGVKDD